MATTAVLGANTSVGAAIARKLRLDGHHVIEANPTGSAIELKESLASATNVVHAADASATDEVLEAASGTGAEHVVLLSTAAVYGAWADNPVPLTEDAIMRPNPGIDEVFARAEIERRSHEWAADHPGCAITILRPCTVVVPGADDWPSADLDGVSGLGSGDGTRPVQFLHVEDFAGAVAVVLDNAITGVRNVAPPGWISEDEARALSGGRVVALPEPVRGAARRLRLGKTVDRGAAALTQHPWVVASDALRAEGWSPVYDNREALVATRRPTWFQRLSPTRRQELSMVAIGGATVAGLTAAGVAVARRVRK
ncbi:MAG TPA: NAD-dependent epimerase/dehydratase family protein [Acidimicrobiales bacterium]|nr:NAD-dependent epimerase/dehydratase family protein [Acidimicrobiales bacterium]